MPVNFSKKVIILCTVFFKIQTFAMEDLPGRLPGIINYGQLNQAIVDFPINDLASSYRDLCRSVNNQGQPTQNFPDTLDAFKNAIVSPVLTQINLFNNQIVIPYDQKNFLRRSILTLRNINNIDNNNVIPLHRRNFLITNLHGCKSILSERVDLARIDENVRLGNGVRSHFNHPNLSVNAQNSLNILTGRIFQISVEDNCLASTSSGTLANYNPAGIGIQNKLPQLIPGNNQVLNSIVTCAHAFKSDDGRTISYFVSSNQIDLRTGLPNGMGMNPDENTLIQYLTNNQNSFRITGLCAQDKTNLLNPLFFDVNLTMGQPQFLENEDCVIATIIPNIGGALLQYGGNSTINFFRNQPVLNTRCFSLGYPGCSHYNLNAFNAHPYINLIEGLGEVSPLFITSDLLNLPVFNNGLISCHIPAAQGMSGGDLFYETINIGQSTLDIFGRVTAGDGNDDFGSYLL